MNILSVESLRKSFGSGTLLDSVTFGLEEGEKMGLIGRNGCGKTTLLRIIAGQEPADGGRVVFANGRHLAFISQNPVFTPGQTVLDAIFDQGGETMRRLHDYEEACHRLAATGGSDPRLLERVSELSHLLDISGGWALEAEARAVLGRLGIPEIEARVETLSGGQRKRVAMARGLLLKPDLLILDEPTNHLDADTVAWLEEYLQRYSGALLLVTHDRYFLDRVTNRMIELERGQVQRFEGNYSTYLEKKDEQAIQREGEARRRETILRRELAWLRRGAKARSTKQKARIDRAEALMAQPKVAAEKTVELAAVSSRLGNKILELESISKAYDGRKLMDGFSYRLKRGDRIGIIGPNGAGKTTLLEIIAGRVAPDSGTVTVGETAVIGYFEQEAGTRASSVSPGNPAVPPGMRGSVTFATTGRAGVSTTDLPVEEQRIIDHVKAVAENVPTADGGVISASQMLERFLFPPALQFTPVGRLSGGERRRLALLRLLMCAPNVLLLDEPTNDFDIATLAALEDWLETFDGCLIVASHDRSFLDNTVEQLYRFEPGGVLRGFAGNYTSHLEILAREEADREAREHVVPGRTRPSAASPASSVSSSFSSAPTTASGRPETPASRTASASGNPPRKLSFKEKRELEELELRIADDEARKSEIEAQLAVPSTDFNAVTGLASELQALNDRLDRDMTRWAELAERA